jgi:hypothetical protein
MPVTTIMDANRYVEPATTASRALAAPVRRRAPASRKLAASTFRGYERNDHQQDVSGGERTRRERAGMPLPMNVATISDSRPQRHRGQPGGEAQREITAGAAATR